MSDVFAYSIPLGPNGRAFSFTLPADFNEQDANALIVMLPTLLSNAAVKETQIDVAIPNDFMYHRPTFGGDPLHVAANCKCSMLPVDEDMSSKPEKIDISVEHVRAEGISTNGHADDNKPVETELLLSDNAANDNKPEPVAEVNPANSRGLESVEAIDISPERVDEKPKSKPGNFEPLPPGKWSRDYDKCQSPTCNTPHARHDAKGYCLNCSKARYKRERKAKLRAKNAAIDTSPKRVDETPAPSTNGASRPSVDYESQRKLIEAQTAGKSRADASTNGTAATVQKPVQSTVQSAVRKAPWPLKDVPRDEALRYCARYRIYFSTNMPLDEIAVREGLDKEKFRKVADTFRKDIEHAVVAPDFVESLERAWGRYES
jgi:hypothetical protein